MLLKSRQQFAYILKIILILVPLQSIGLPATVKVQPKGNLAEESDKVVLNFNDADIQLVIRAISKLSGKNYVIDPRVKGTVTIVSDRPIAKSASYKVLSSALRMQGFATVEADGVIKVLPEQDGRTYGMRMSRSAKWNSGDQLITRVFVLETGSASQVAAALRPLVSPNNALAVYPGSNALIITDYASNLARISAIIDNLKLSPGTRQLPEVIELKYANAADVVDTLNNIIGSGGKSSYGSSSSNSSTSAENGPLANISADVISNTVIISSAVPSRISDLKSLALRLDTQAARSNNNLHVVYLKNADAAHVAEVLRVIASSQDNPDLTPSPASRELSDSGSPLQSNSGSGGTGSGGSGFSGGGGLSAGGQHSGSKSASRGSGAPGASTKDKTFNVLIQAEPTTNSLIIQAPEQVYRNLRMVITLLDVRRVQVLIEALIAEVSSSIKGNFGIQWMGGIGNDNGGVGVLSNYGDSPGAEMLGKGFNFANGLQGKDNKGGGNQDFKLNNNVYIGVVTGNTQIGGQTIPTISVLADMLSSNDANNILSRPTLMTLDNEEAAIFVGQNIGLTNGTMQNSAANPGNITTSVSRTDVGTLLRLQPLVTQNGAIQLSIYQEDSVKDTGGMTPEEINLLGPNYNKRSLKTQVLVDDGQIIALGGMTNDKVIIQSSGIPFLSSIPYLGWLFKWEQRLHDKKNLVLFLRPLIVRNQEGASALTNQRYRYIVSQENAVQAKGNLLLPDIAPVTMDNQVPYGNPVLPLSAESAPVLDTPIIDLRGASSKPSQDTTKQISTK